MLYVVVNIQAICPGYFGNAADHCTCLCTTYCVQRHPVLTADRKGSQCAFTGKIIDRHFPITQEYLQIFFLIQAVVNPFCGFALGKDCLI